MGHESWRCKENGKHRCNLVRCVSFCRRQINPVFVLEDPLDI
jgi:hypothetical protein